MIHRALRADILADYLLAYTWFDSKAMLRLRQGVLLVALLRMKINKLNYRLTGYADGKIVNRQLTIQAFYQHCARKA